MKGSLIWQDALDWLPNCLREEPTRMRFGFADDNETIREIQSLPLAAKGFG
jgi:hypothetical protein